MKARQSEASEEADAGNAHYIYLMGLGLSLESLDEPYQRIPKTNILTHTSDHC
jgi:hypothetical protein